MSWLIKLAFCMAIVGVVGFDGVSVLHNYVSAADAANRAALAARDSWSTRPDIQAAYAAAEVTAQGSGGTVPKASFVISASGTVQLAVRRTAPTFILCHIGPLKHLATITQHGTGEVVPS